MPVYLINGPSGAGKTSIGSVLHDRGFKVVETDEVFGYYGSIETGERVSFPGQTVTEDWYRKNGWLWDLNKAEEALSSEDHGAVFWCGGALNESALYHRFSNIFRLVVRPDVFDARMAKRGNDEHTNNPEFIKKMHAFLEIARSEGEKAGMTIIDTSSTSPAQAADLILSHINEN